MLAIGLLVVLSVLLIFLIYSILSVAFKSKENNQTVQSNQPAHVNSVKPIPYKASFDDSHIEEPEQRLANAPSYQELQKANNVAAENEHSETQSADVHEPPMVGSTKLETPEVAGQSEEELNAPEPLQEKVSVKAEPHEAMDPFEKDDNVALFGSNLRHPEASFERSSVNFGALENEIVAGLASQVSKPTDLEKVQFSAEMAQNGGEFMNGIFAYDSSEGGSYFSSL